MTQNAWQVHKFGGSSLTDARCFHRVANILMTNSADRQAVVVSAMGGMTDALLNLVTAAEKSSDSIDPGLRAIEERYVATVQELIGNTPVTEGV